MSTKSAISNIKKHMDAINATRRKLVEDYTKIDGDIYKSDLAKKALKQDAKHEAFKTLETMRQAANIDIQQLRDDIKARRDRFDFDDTRFTTVCNFITTSGQNIPEAAISKIISEYSGRPAQLKFLTALFEQQKMAAAVIEANETLKETETEATLADRLEDSIYYAVQEDTTKDHDFSAQMEELNRYEQTISDEN